jgi:hypothetical protein
LKAATAVSLPAGAFLVRLSSAPVEGFLGFRGLGFHGLGEFGGAAGHDGLNVLGVGGGLVSHGLDQAGLQGQQFLRVLGRQDGLGVAERLFHHGFGGSQVQFDQLFEAGESLGGEALQGLQVGFVGGGELFSGVFHFKFLK